MPPDLGTILATAKEIWKFATDEEVVEGAKNLWRFLKEEYGDGDDAATSGVSGDLVSRALHRMNKGAAPRIALVGMTSAGKSSLVNALFGAPVAEVRRTADTTESVIEVGFPSGLVVYDTPGVGGDEAFENITRLFLNLPQDPDLDKVDSVPIRAGESGVVRDIRPDGLRRVAPIDCVLFTMDLFRTLNRHDKKHLRNLYLELEKEYGGRLIVAGTHLDVLQGEGDDLAGQMETYGAISGNALYPVSSTTGEGLAELVLALFRTLPDRVSLSKMQQSLVTVRKLDRLAFVITDISKHLANLIGLSGRQEEEIQLATFTMWAVVCLHYSVDEETWLQHNGDVAALADTAGKEGKQEKQIQRKPQGFLETLRSVFFRTKFYDRSVEYRRLGAAGLAKVLPAVCQLLAQLDDQLAPFESAAALSERLSEVEGEIDSALDRGDLEGAASTIGSLIGSALGVASE